MKKIIPILLASILVTGTLTFNSCKKNDEGDKCSELYSKFNTAVESYINDPTSSTKCKAYKNAALDYLNGCGNIDATTRQQIKDQYEQLNCN